MGLLMPISLHLTARNYCHAKALHKTEKRQKGQVGMKPKKLLRKCWVTVVASYHNYVSSSSTNFARQRKGKAFSDRRNWLCASPSKTPGINVVIVPNSSGSLYVVGVPIRAAVVHTCFDSLAMTPACTPAPTFTVNQFAR